MGKLSGSGGGLGVMPKMGHPLPRLGFEMWTRPDCDRVSAIFPDFEGNRAQSMGLRSGALFLLANRGFRSPKLWVNYGPLEEGWG